MYAFRRRSRRRLFDKFSDVIVELIFTDPDYFNVIEKFGLYSRMARKILLDFAEHQALAGIVRPNEDSDPLRGDAKRLGKRGELQRNRFKH
jgi:hypothetical protein